MNLECPQCSSPVSRDGQRFCNRCGNDLRSFYEARGITLPAGPSELPPETPDKELAGTLEMPSSVNVDVNRVESSPISHTVAVELPDITIETTPAGAAAGQKASLRILLPSSDVFDRDLKKAETLIGKGPRNDIVLADPAVSTSHAMIRQQDGSYLIQDMGSRNGTLINGRKITAAEKLNHGDVVGMGTTKLTFRLEGHPDTAIINMPDVTAPIPTVRLPLTEESLATVLVRDGVAPSGKVNQLRGAGANGRRLYRALVEENLASEEAMRDAMSLAFGIPVLDLRAAQIDDVVAAKISPQLARDKWVFPVEERSRALLLAVADPTDEAAINDVKSKLHQPVELRLATAKEILERVDRHFGPRLVGVLPTGEKIEYLITKPEVEIGKAPHNQIVLTDPTVSNTHAVILARDGGYNIVDLGSRNGTFVNGERLTTHARTLRHGDSVQMGQTLWTFRNPGETPENVTAVLSPEALEEVRRRAGIASPTPSGHPQPNGLPIAQPVEVTTIPVQPLINPPVEVPRNGAEDEVGDEKKKKKKKNKEKSERERIKAAYIRAVGGILATILSVILTVLLTIYINHSMRQQSQTANTAGGGTIDISIKGHSKFKLENPTAGTAIEGGKYEASGALQIAGTEGIFFVDNGKSKEIFWMPVDASGRQAGAVQPIPHGMSVSDPESIAYGGGFIYVMSSLSYPEDGEKNALLRFAVDPQTHTLQGSAEAMTGIREFLTENVPELRDAANLRYDQGGINIEGIAWDPVHERLVLGFRSPVVNGNALLVPLKLKDPRGPFSTQNLTLPDAPIELPLGGLGIRDLNFDTRASAFILIAGSVAQGEAKEFMLFEWSGETDLSKPDATPKELARLDSKMKPEGLTRLRVGGRDFLLVVGDAGSYSKFDIVEGP